MSVDPQPDPYDELGHLYDEWVVSVVEDVPFYVAVADELATVHGRPLEIIELGAGSGRITLPLARRGHRVRAIDVAQAQLDRLQRAVDAAGAAGHELLVDVVPGDMRELRLLAAPDSADLVVAPFRCLLHVADEREQVLAEVAQVLRPGGTLVFDVFHPTADTVSDTQGRWQLRERWHDDTEEGTWSIWERARFGDDMQTLDLDVRCEFQRSSLARAGGVGAQPEQRLVHMRLRTPSAHEWHAALTASGFAVERVLGWFDGTPMDAQSEDSIWIARTVPG